MSGVRQAFVRATTNEDDIPGGGGKGRGLKRPRSLLGSQHQYDTNANSASIYEEVLRSNPDGPVHLSEYESRSQHHGGGRPVSFGPERMPVGDGSGGGGGGFYCQTCGEVVASVSRSAHDTSTLHLFNRQYLPGRKVQIHESNKGFQMLEGMGWSVDEGLGPQKQGCVNPLSTTFKQGRAGLGAERLRARVTHFPSHLDSEALNSADGKSRAVRAQEHLGRGVETPAAVRGTGGPLDGTGLGVGGGGGQKSERIAKEEAQRRHNKSLRFQLFSDIPEEYEALYMG